MGAGPTSFASPRCIVFPCTAILQRANASLLPRREERPRRAARRALASARSAPRAHRCCRGLQAGRGWPAGAPSGGTGSSQPSAPTPAPPGCSPRPGRVSRAAQTLLKSSRPLDSALRRRPARTCKLSPAHMLHIKPPCPVPFLIFFLRKGSYKLPFVYLAWFSLLQFCMGCLCLVY